jgi:hypothetical protein
VIQFHTIQISDEKLDHDLTELLSQEEGQDQETAQDMRRELYGFERVKLGCYGDFEETIVEKNRKVLRTIANFVLLAANAVKDTRRLVEYLKVGVGFMTSKMEPST